MRDKPRIFKGAEGWAVELPAFGFGRPQVECGFSSQNAVCEWLKARAKHAPTGGQFDRTATPSPAYFYGTDIWPVIVR